MEKIKTFNKFDLTSKGGALFLTVKVKNKNAKFKLPPEALNYKFSSLEFCLDKDEKNNEILVVTNKVNNRVFKSELVS